MTFGLPKVSVTPGILVTVHIEFRGIDYQSWKELRNTFLLGWQERVPAGIPGTRSSWDPRNAILQLLLERDPAVIPGTHYLKGKICQTHCNTCNTRGGQIGGENVVRKQLENDNSFYFDESGCGVPNERETFQMEDFQI